MYGITFRDNTVNVQKNDVVQKRVIRIVENLSFICSGKFVKLSLLTVYDLCILESQSLFKVVKQTCIMQLCIMQLCKRALYFKCQYSFIQLMSL